MDKDKELSTLERKLAANPTDISLQEKYDRARERLGLSPEIIHFVYRHRDEPLGKRVVTLRAKSILHWFQWLWGEVTNYKSKGKEHEFDDKYLGGDVYSFAGIPLGIRESSLPCPKSVEDVERLLEYTYNEEVRVNEHTARVLSDDDEVDLCYYFFSAEYALKNPERVTYLLHSDTTLPTNWIRGSYEMPSAVDPAIEEQPDEGTLYALDFELGQPGYFEVANSSRVAGIRLPDLEPVLTQCDSDEVPHPFAPLAKSIQAGRSLFEAWRSLGENHKQESIVFTEHFAQIGHRFFLFDDYWAAAHPDLATSLIYAANYWDPFEDLSSESDPEETF